MEITPNTKISAILKDKPEALEAIVSLSPKFEKLRNPVMRKLMAGRASIAMASKAGGISIEDFYNKLRPLGFIPCLADTRAGSEAVAAIKKEAKDWDELLASFTGKLISIDVRELEMPGPMMTILESLNTLPPGYALFVYHKRIPLFLLPELAERKLDYRVKEIAEGEVHLLIFKP